MLESRKVTRAEDGKVRVGFGNQMQYLKAHKNQEREAQFGLSPADQQDVAREMRAEYGEEWRRANSR